MFSNIMKLTEFLQPENIHTGVFASSKKRALELIGKMVADSLNQQIECEPEQQICSVACFSHLFQREKLGTTALNNGIALPHAKLPYHPDARIEKPIAVFLQLDNPIDFEADDHKEVDLIYAILFPEQVCSELKGCLVDLAERLSDKTLLKHLRSAENAQDIWQILSYADQHSEQSQEP